MSKLNGWQRLGLALASFYLLAIAFGTWATLPKANHLPHSFSLYEQISPAQKRLILNSQVKPENEAAFVADAGGIADAQLIEMPNAHTLVFRAATPQPEMTAATRAYWAAAEEAASSAQRIHVYQGFAWWAAPILALYILVLLAKWIYRGFRPAAGTSAA